MNDAIPIMDSVRRLYLHEKALYSTSLELTYGCGLNCFHCYNANQNRKELSTQEVFGVLEQLAHLRCLYLTLTGGEPHCRKDLPTIVREAKRLGFAVTVFSNGTLLDNKIVDKMKEAGVLKYCISLFAMDEAVHDGITRSPGSYLKTHQGIKLLRERGIRLHLKCIVTKKNFSEYKRVLQFAGELGLHCEIDFNLMPARGQDKSILKYCLDNAELERVLADARPAPGISVVQDKNLLSTIRRQDLAETQVLCTAGVTTLSINPYGDVFPCNQLMQLAGNIREQSLDAIWHHAPLLQHLRRLSLDDLKTCRNCKHLAYCARCPAAAMNETGRLTESVQFACRVAKVFSQLNKTRILSEPGPHCP